MKDKHIKIVELFAGVGGFHLGFQRANRILGMKKHGFDIVWANQWEPGKINQPAFKVYKKHFNKSTDDYSNIDIHEVVEKYLNKIPSHHLLVGGFPCQDYSVARASTQARGIKGKKGVLWWDIYKILKNMGRNGPKYLMLENVDRLLKSPTNQRGRDFAIMLSSLSKLDYAVEWRVINAAEYGMPQRRRRTYILGYKKGTNIYSKLKKCVVNKKTLNWFNGDGIFAKAFPINPLDINTQKIFLERLKIDLTKITTEFNKNNELKNTPFETAGIMIDRKVYTAKISPVYFKNKKDKTTLKDIVDKTKEIPSEYIIDISNKQLIEKWKTLKGPKRGIKLSRDKTYSYPYGEGGMAFPDFLDRPSRTIITGEGGPSPSRFKHVIEYESGYRRLIPEELEALNMFPRGHTKMEGISDAKRAFFMGNALVVGIVTKLAVELYKEIK